jgi:hypothetical protein
MSKVELQTTKYKLREQTAAVLGKVADHKTARQGMKSLDHIFRTVLSETLAVWSTVFEITKIKGWRSRSSLTRAIRVTRGNAEFEGSLVSLFEYIRRDSGLATLG